MWQTIFHIPHAVGGLPVFGWGWALLIWSAISLGSAWQSWRKHGAAGLVNGLPFSLLIAAGLVFLLPHLEMHYAGADGQTARGIAIRGYGVMLLVATVSGLSLAIARARKRGLDSEPILMLATWMFVFGIIGARLFYIIQYWESFRNQSWTTMVAGMLNVTQGGLVVYGSLFGAILAFALFVSKYRLPALPLADLIAPSLVLGLAIGRIGCFLNGCCYGGPCDHAWGVRFPAESIPYAEQLADGVPFGFTWQAGTTGQIRVVNVVKGGALDQAGLTTDDRIVSVNGTTLTSLGPTMSAADSFRYLMAGTGTQVTLTAKADAAPSARDIHASLSELPARTSPLHPTQLYSSITAGLLCFLLLAAEPFLPRPGQVFALLITIYPVCRFLLEIIRTDESSFWGTGMTISQNVSLALLAMAVVLWVVTYRVDVPPPDKKPVRLGAGA